MGLRGPPSRSGRGVGIYARGRGTRPERRHGCGRIKAREGYTVDHGQGVQISDRRRTLVALKSRQGTRRFRRAYGVPCLAVGVRRSAVARRAARPCLAARRAVLRLAARRSSLLGGGWADQPSSSEKRKRAREGASSCSSSLSVCNSSQLTCVEWPV